MGYEISNNVNLINYLPLSSTQPHNLLLTHCDNDGKDHRHLITTSSEDLGDDRKNDIPAAKTLRWNPTPEQITTLEEIYRSGIRTPTTDEIQKIASKLREYGKIQGKNVFYWFQNHKARERLKRRRSEGDAANKQHKDIKDSSSVAFIANDHEDHETAKECEKASKNGKDATWRQHVTQKHINEEEEEEEETREIRMLNLFPVIQKEEQTGGYREKTKAKVCCKYCYLYEFIPLKN